MPGWPMDQAAVALATAVSTIEAVGACALDLRIADRRMMEALDVLSAAMSTLDPAQAEATRARLLDRRDAAAAIAEHYGKDARVWAHPYLTRMGAIARNGA